MATQKLFAAIALLFVVSFATTLAGQTYPLNQQNVSTAGFNSGGAANCQRGYRFQCNGTGVNVTRLGCWYPDGTTQAKTVTLFNFTTQAILAQVTCGPGSGWQFTNLTTPIPLVNGGQYIVEGFTTTASYYFGNPGASWIPTGVIQYLDMRYANACTANTFPTSTLTNIQYGIVDFGYTTGPGLATSVSTLPLGSTPQGSAGATQSYTVSGNQTTAPTLVTAPANVEVSLNQSTWGSSVTIATTGTWGPTTVYARIAAGAPAGAISGNITHVSAGLTTVNVAVTGSVVLPGWVMQQTVPTGTGVSSTTTGDYTMGYYFQCNAANVVVTHLGACSPTAGTRICSLWHLTSGPTSTTGTLLGQVTTANGVAGAWREGQLSMPIVLTQNQYYIVCTYTANAGYYGITSSANSVWHPTTGPIIHYENRWANTNNPNVMPTNTSGATYWHWGLADLRYTTNPAVAASVASLNLGTTGLNTPGSTVSYNVQGFGTTNATSITAPANVEIKLSTDTTWGGVVNISSTGNWGPLTINARIASTATATTITGSLVHASTGSLAGNVVLSGSVIPPTLTTSLASIALGTTPQGTASTAVSYTVSGVGMTGTTSIFPPQKVQVSFSQTTGFVDYPNSLDITATGNWGPTVIWARIASSAAPGAVTGNITHSSSGATTVNVSVSGNVTPPTLTPNPTSINLGSTPQGTAGTPATYNLSGSGMQALTTITAPANVEVSFSQTTGYLDSIQVATTGQWGPTAIWARIKSSAPQGSVTGNITHASTGATTVNVAVNGTVTGPTVLTNTNTLALGSTYLTYAGTPASYTVSGSILPNTTLITAPTGVEVSFSQTTGYADQITETQTGTWGPTTVWARIKANAAQGAISGNIAHTSTGAATVNVSVNGTVNPPAIVPSQGSIALGQTTAGTAGTPTNYTITGTGTSASTVITAPTGVEVSFSQTTGYAASITETQTGAGTWGPTTIWARITDTAAPGAISGNITHATTGATTANVSVSGNVIDLQANPTSLNLGVTTIGVPGTPQSYVLTGSGLVGNTTITAPAEVEISDTLTGTYGPTLTLTGATLSEDIFARLTGANLGAVGGNISNTNNGVTVFVSITGNVTPPNNLNLTRNGPAASTNVDNNDQGPGGNGLLVLDFELSTNQATWTVTDITFTESGTADGQTDINFIGLYEDSGNGVWDDPATDTIATAAAGAGFSGPDGDYVATLSNSAWAVSTTRQFFLVLKLAGTASPGETIQAEITAMTTNTGGGGVTNGVPTSGGAALTINPAVLDATFNGPSAFVTVPNSSQGAGGNGEMLLDFTLAAQNDSWTVTSLTFTASGTADEQADINFLALYVDNGNGTFDGPATDALATAAAGAGFNAPNGTYTATLTGAASTFAMNASKRFFLVAKLAGTATSAETFRAALTSMVETSPSAGTVTGVPTVASSALVIDVPTLTVNAGPANPADTYIEFTGAAFTHTLGEIRMTASNDNFTISGVTLTLQGNGDWVNNVALVKVFLDNGNGNFDVADTQLFSGVAGATSVNCGFSTNVTVNSGTSSDLWVVIDVAATAGGSPSETFNARIQAPTDVQQVTTGNVLIGSTPPVSGTLHVIVFAITSFTPLQDAFAGGAFITITGSGFAAPISCTINGVPCTGTATADATGTTITGLRVPQGSGQGLTIVLTTNNLGPKTLTQTFSYNGSIVSGGGGGGGGGGCETSSTGTAALLGILGLLALAATLRRRKA